MSAIDLLIQDAVDSLTPQPDIYAGSPFEPILKESSRRRGKAGEQLAIRIYDMMLRKELPRHAGLVTGTSNSQSDMDVMKTLVEVKTSKLWYNADEKKLGFKFQQIRDQDYEYVFLLGYVPNGDLWMWNIPKSIIWHNTDGQHGGQYGDVKWSDKIIPGNIPDWMNNYGGLWKASSMKEPQKALRKKLLAPFEAKIAAKKFGRKGSIVAA